ncbi:MAG: hypothetical protein NTY76_00495 [Candidatus Omnitrophica bacterium]|nr:hypothetical protein [Candidatus Omnitrophota bacterium]
MKERILGVAILALVLSAASVNAEETVFNQAKKCVEGWKAPCVFTSTCAKAEPAKGTAEKPMHKMWTMDVLGNKIPTGTMKECCTK